MRELDGLKSRPNLGNSAREATRVIHSFLSVEQENNSSTTWLELQAPLERPRGTRYHRSADEEVLRACEMESARHSQVVLITGKRKFNQRIITLTDDVNLQARALSRRIPTDSLNSFMRAINAFYSNYSKYGDGLSAEVKMRGGQICLTSPAF